MDGEGTLKNLIDDVFRLILDQLSFQDLANLRIVSPELKCRVTRLKYGLFDTLCIKGINKVNSEETMITLNQAMTGPLRPKKLVLKFDSELDSTMKLMLLQYKENISSLAFKVKANATFLQQQSLIFVNLGGLYLVAGGCEDDEMKSVLEAMLLNHAKKLKDLYIDELNLNIFVPALPLLDTLKLVKVCSDAAWKLFYNSRRSLTSLKLKATDIKSPVFNNRDYTDAAAYKMPNLKTLQMIRSFKGFNLILPNAGNLVSLRFIAVGDIPDVENLDWPNFPNLRELSISDKILQPIILQSRTTLERLELYCHGFEVNVSAVKMPRLTDLFMSNVRPEYVTEMLRLNHDSLEFLTLGDISLSNINIDDDKRMEKMRSVVLVNCTALDREKMASLCPNAQVFLLDPVSNRREITDLFVKRKKSKGFHFPLL